MICNYYAYIFYLSSLNYTDPFLSDITAISYKLELLIGPLLVSDIPFELSPTDIILVRLLTLSLQTFSFIIFSFFEKKLISISLESGTTAFCFTIFTSWYSLESTLWSSIAPDFYWSI